ncbi:MAG TPA: hypothetical protein VMR17_20055, partial [Xanthobacteraceae bacterium]|nr:hypothetical protein [Xanthobacteraceae bacterium]
MKGDYVSDEAEPPTGGFDCLDDLFCRIDRRSEERNRMAAIWRDGLVKSYVEGRVNIECVVTPSP